MSDTAPVTRPNDPYTRFEEAFFGTPRRDGPDVTILDELTPAQRERAEQQLINRLPESGAMDGLAHLGSRRAVEPLRTLMQGPRPTNVYAAIALWGIRPDPEALAVLCHSVEHRPRLRRRHERAYAAAALRNIDRQEAIAALITALEDRDIAVRANAELAVQERLRLNVETDARDSGHMTRSEFRTLAWAALEQHYPAN
jgi:hypothetical protein